MKARQLFPIPMMLHLNSSYTPHHKSFALHIYWAFNNEGLAGVAVGYVEWNNATNKDVRDYLNKVDEQMYKNKREIKLVREK